MEIAVVESRIEFKANNQKTMSPYKVTSSSKINNSPLKKDSMYSSVCNYHRNFLSLMVKPLLADKGMNLLLSPE